MTEPDNTAVRTALWRAIHVLVDAEPHVFEDEVGLQLVAPPEGWRERGDMHPEGTKLFRASIVARARFVEDVLAEQMGRGVAQYVILGAGLDTFTQRHPELASRLHVFEVDQPGTQAWKRQRLVDLGYGVADWLSLVPVDFAAGEKWRERVMDAGFDASLPAVIASTGVSMYLTKEANADTMRDVASCAPGSTFVMSFLLQPELASEEVRAGLEMSARGAQASGTPFVSFFTPEEVLAMGREAGFKTVEHVTSGSLGQRYFSGRTDGLHPPEKGEELLVATT